MPTKFDFITQSNSKTIELFIGKRELQNMLQTPNKILSIELNEKIDGEIRYMLGCKVALSKRKFFLFKQNIELFQAVENEKVGTVDLSGKWQVDSLLVRNTLILGALKFYLGSKVEVEQRILDIK